MFNVKMMLILATLPTAQIRVITEHSCYYIPSRTFPKNFPYLIILNQSTYYVFLLGYHAA